MALIQSVCPAAAYIDPATTSYIIQIAVGAAVAVGACIGIFSSKLRRAFRKKNEQEETPAAPTAAKEGQKDISAADLLDDDDAEKQ